MAIVELKACEPVVPQLAEAQESVNFKAGNHVFRYLRRQILTFRSDIWRANIIYGAYDLGAPYPDPDEVKQAQSNSSLLKSDSRKSSELPFAEVDGFR
ncbi:MAG: hypothetical protein WCC87_00515 [Candidatus Korobacteraceae bacterium]